MSVDFSGRVAIVTGAGNGLGRSHALELAKRGAKVVVNDLGGARDGTGASSAAADEVVNLITEAGGEAFAHGANVAKFDEVEDMVKQAMERWGRVDILINNAGILRDKSFSKMALADFQLVMDVHLMGTVNCCKAVWEIMKEQQYGRIVMTTSSSGLYGNFGQTNYGAAKMAVIGLMNTLVLEGQKYDIRVNALAPTAGTRMTEDLMPEEILAMLKPESVTAGALTLVTDDAPNKFILCAGAGGYAASKIVETEGIFLPESEQNPEAVLAQWDAVVASDGDRELESGAKQSEKFLTKAMQALQGA
ncbi:SDR family NAD(P)-dependent oxidoreductase [Pseudoteredinibacter isoporae]|uniref:NAD(P)-dependent dehydrogenase (Short-subunit alcohol dehydrogenase family) n=1 Tax=Pseudoteredinibacter isoporae TaxID=570281 RepID=A0A7X0JVA7_9GAMM|nr:SDR family NAD(P)-dependent oxidoreductase [Pseudoteredinibacter isoporae]MBB6522056.1 NAD(P)-dependent dehydrogenase (short-subunit alcohol dehydrogenase family) [Pseudoteredinibacter isoporae]NHO87591.1 SDR family NAD(P)-dependent oxidoreductase [Pseudoteredinibacter isoporae]NIB24078.1 SDR family NAD(P)-dependent oxidoreductase [Pseudoteredinibacter isoporae]